MVEKKVDIFVQFRTNMKEFAGVMKMPLENFKKLGDSSGRVDKNMTKNVSTMGRFGLGVRKLTHGMRGFRMEMLGVMFFGMMIQRTFMGLLRPALEMSGAMQLLSTVLGIMFLPVGLALIDFAIELLNWWNSLSSENQKQITNWILLGLALGTVMMVVGQFVLGIGSLILAFGGLLGPIGLVVAAIAGFFLWTQYNEQIKEGLMGIVGWIDQMWERFLEWEPVKNALESLGVDIEDLKDPIEIIKNKWGEFTDWILLKLDELGLGDTLDSWSSKMKGWGTTIIELIPVLENLAEMLGKIVGWIEKLGPFAGTVGGIIGGFMVGGPIGGAIGGAGGAGFDIARLRNRRDAEQNFGNLPQFGTPEFDALGTKTDNTVFYEIRDAIYDMNNKMGYSSAYSTTSPIDEITYGNARPYQE